MCLCEGTSICTSIGSAPKPWDASNLANAYAFLVDTDVAGEAGATFRRGRERERGILGAGINTICTSVQLLPGSGSV